MTIKRVLVIEDDSELREVIRLSLEIMADLEVTTASRGLEGLQLATANRPDAILLDVMLPDIDGLLFCHRLRQQAQTQDIPIVLITANRYRLDPLQVQELGISAVLSKPFKPPQLAQQLLMALDPGSADPPGFG